VTTALRNADGSLRGFVKVMRDETYRKQSEHILQDSKRAAEDANHLKDDFLAVVSHELRTPLSGILLWSKLLEKADLSDATYVRSGLNAIRTSAEAQKELIEDLLDMSRITSGQLRLQMRDVELRPVVQDALDAIAPTAQAKEITLNCELDKGVGVAHIDPDRIRQMIWNLLTNAVKFTPSGGRVDVTMAKREKQIEIRVVDTGIGMGPEFLPHVFQRFRQADASQARAHGGLGLGLAIVKQLAELHGGTVRAESEGAGKGSTFVIQLPLSETPGKRKRAKSEGEGAATQRGLEGLHALLVEDDQHTREGIATILAQAGIQVSEAHSAAAAVEIVERHSPDVIISDVGLPGEDGYALIRRIRKSEASSKKEPTPAVAVTAFVRETDRRMAIAAGFQHHISKPIEPEMLLAAVREVTRRG
jgi:CheY-like chemotaxis protein/nitrogen-specific signal transduction histidine kinase